MSFLTCIKNHLTSGQSFAIASATFFLGLLLGGNCASAIAKGVVPFTSEQGVTSMDAFGSPIAPPSQPIIIDKEKPKKIQPFLRDSIFDAQIRTYFFNRQNYNNSLNEALTVGGSLAYKSGYLAERFRIGAAVYTSQRLYGPDGRDGSNLLQQGQKGYSVLGQLYGDFKITDQLIASIGRKAFNTPYINGNDSRMTPNTFQGYSIFGTTADSQDAISSVRYGAAYISKIKERNSEKFVWMSSAAGADAHRGVYAVGANFLQKDFTVGAVNYYAKDIINIFYTEAKYTGHFNDKYLLTLSAQYTDQKSTGDDLLKGYAFSSHQAGVKADISVGSAIWTIAYSKTDDGGAMQSPWSGYPGFTSVQVKSFNRASESAFMLRAGYDFSGIGFNGLSVYALRVHGFGVENALYDEDETDLNLQWKQTKDTLKGFSLRARYALVRQRGDGNPSTNEFRLIVNYDL